MISPVYNKNWSADIKALYKHDMEQTWDSTLMPHLFNEYSYFMEYFCSFASAKGPLRILDGGCAQGTLALLLAEAGHQVVALDLRQGFIDYAKTRYEHGDVNFICGNLFDYQPETTFDLIFINQVIEHLLNPVDLVRLAAGWLRSGGCLVVTTPSGIYVKSKLPTFSQLGPLENYRHLENSADGDGHFYAYTPDELERVFFDAGITDVRSRCISTPWISGHMKFRYLHRWLPFGLLRFADFVTRQIPYTRSLCSQLTVTGVKSS